MSWNRIEDGLPQDDQVVLAAIDGPHGKRYAVASLTGRVITRGSRKGWLTQVGGVELHGVTHWREFELIEKIQDIARRKCPWPDFAGNEIYEGDTLQHPGASAGHVVERFTVKFDESKAIVDGALCWRAVYSDGMSLYLGHQISDRGQAVVVKA